MSLLPEWISGDIVGVPGTILINNIIDMLNERRAKCNLDPQPYHSVGEPFYWGDYNFPYEYYADHTDSGGDWTGATWEGSIPVMTQQKVLAAIGDTERVTFPSSGDLLSWDWGIQTIKMLDQLQWVTDSYNSPTGILTSANTDGKRRFAGFNRDDGDDPSDEWDASSWNSTSNPNPYARFRDSDGKTNGRIDRVSLDAVDMNFFLPAGKNVDVQIYWFMQDDGGVGFMPDVYNWADGWNILKEMSDVKATDLPLTITDFNYNNTMPPEIIGSEHRWDLAFQVANDYVYFCTVKKHNEGSGFEYTLL